jgi:hypothetical protein
MRGHTLAAHCLLLRHFPRLQAALDDKVPLMEIQFPPAGLETVPVRAHAHTQTRYFGRA